LAPITAVESSITGYTGLSSIIVEAKTATGTNDAQSEITTILNTRHRIKAGKSADYQIFNQA